MRTTVVLDDKLFREAKKRAAEAHLSVSALVSQALRDALHPATRASARPRSVFRIQAFGGTERLAHEPSDLKTLIDEDSETC